MRIATSRRTSASSSSAAFKGAHVAAEHTASSTIAKSVPSGSAIPIRAPRPKPAPARVAAIVSTFRPRSAYVRARSPGVTIATASEWSRIEAASNCESMASGWRGLARDGIAGSGVLIKSKLAPGGIDGKHLYRRRLALERHGAERLDCDALAQRRARGFVDQNDALGDLGVRLEARGQIDGIADAGVSRALVRPRVSGHHFAGGDPDADPDRRLSGRRAFDVEQVDQLDHFLSGAHGALTMVGERHRRAEDGHQPVAHHQRHHAAVTADRIEHKLVICIEQLDGLLG